MKYLWTEDTGAGYHFWQLVNHLARKKTMEQSISTTRTNDIYSIL